MAAENRFVKPRAAAPVGRPETVAMLDSGKDLLRTRIINFLYWALFKTRLRYTRGPTLSVG
jgi:hypothetical protein